MNDTAVMICGHGSRDTDAIREFDAMVASLRGRLPDFPVGSGFLEFARPIIREGLDELKAKGAKRILALPAMLFAAGHVKNDLPWELNTWAAENPGIKVEFGRDLAIDLKLVEAAQQRIEEAEARAEVGAEDQVGAADQGHEHDEDDDVAADLGLPPDRKESGQHQRLLTYSTICRICSSV